MNQIDSILSNILLSIESSKFPKDELDKLNKVNLSRKEVVSVISIFLDDLQIKIIDLIKKHSFEKAVLASKIEVYFCKKYFNQIVENGYYKGYKIESNKDFYCKDCHNFFDVETGTRVSQIRCTNCKSDNAIWSKTLIKSKINGKSQEEIIEICRKKYTKK